MYNSFNITPLILPQLTIVHPAVPVRAVPALLQLLLPADRVAAADPRRVSHGALDHAHAAHTHPLCQCPQGDRGRLCEFIFF